MGLRRLLPQRCATVLHGFGLWLGDGGLGGLCRHDRELDGMDGLDGFAARAMRRRASHKARISLKRLLRGLSEQVSLQTLLPLSSSMALRITIRPKYSYLHLTSLNFIDLKI